MPDTDRKFPFSFSGLLLKAVFICKRCQTNRLVVKYVQAYQGRIKTKIMKIKKIYLKGMDCSECEESLEGELQKISGVISADVSNIGDKAEIYYEEKEPDFTDIKRIAKELGYEAQEILPQEEEDEKDKTAIRVLDWINAILIVAGLIFLHRFLSSLDILEKFNSQNLGFQQSFLFGFAASLFSYLTLTGALVLAFGKKYRSEGKSFYERAVRPNIFLQAGRIASFFVFGGIVSMLGEKIYIAERVSSFASFFMAIIMLLIGLQLLKIFPAVPAIIKIRITNKINRRFKGFLDMERSHIPVFLGALTFFIHMGLNDSLRILSANSQGILHSAENFLFFSLGTLPILMLTGVASSWANNCDIRISRKVAGLLIIISAAYFLGSF